MNDLTLVQMDYEKNEFPLGAAYLTSALERENIPFDLMLYPLHKKTSRNLSHLYSFLANTNRILAIGCWSDMLPYVLVTLRRIKREFPNKIIILGGVGPTIAAEEILKKFPCVDFIIKGCGVKPFPKLIKKLTEGNGATFEDVERLVFRKEGGIVSHPYGRYSLEIPDFPSFDRISHLSRRNHVPLITSFGCPYKCTYCDTRPVSPQVVVYRPLDKVIQEIKFIKKFKHPQKFMVAVYDEAFTVNKKRVFEFCDSLKREQLEISWACFGRVDTVDEELLKVMAQRGCFGIFYGIESGSNRILKKIKKGFTIERAVEKILLSQRYIKNVDASFIFGFPFETEADFRKTLVIRNALLQRGVRAPLFPLTPVKNSELYQKYKKTLKFSPRATRYNLDIGMPGEVARTIRESPGIFSNFYHYDSKELGKIMKLFRRVNNRTFPVAPGIQAFFDQHA